jgi:hypothetical protein
MVICPQCNLEHDEGEFAEMRKFLLAIEDPAMEDKLQR